MFSKLKYCENMPGLLNHPVFLISGERRVEGEDLRKQIEVIFYEHLL